MCTTLNFVSKIYAADGVLLEVREGQLARAAIHTSWNSIIHIPRTGGVETYLTSSHHQTLLATRLRTEITVLLLSTNRTP